MVDVGVGIEDWIDSGVCHLIGACKVIAGAISVPYTTGSRTAANDSGCPSCHSMRNVTGTSPGPSAIRCTQFQLGSPGDPESHGWTANWASLFEGPPGCWLIQASFEF